MKKTYYRVECNYGSKYFDKGIEAYIYFSQMSVMQKESVELWLINKECTKKLFSITQELIAYAPCIEVLI